MTHIYTDASIGRNSQAKLQGGIGIYYGDNDIRNVSATLTYATMTIQSLETDAVHAALQNLGKAKDVTIFSDSQHAVECINLYNYFESRKWLNAKNKPIVHVDIIKKCKAIIDKRKSQGKITTIKHVLAHTGIKGNEGADRLAGLASGVIKSTIVCNNVASNIPIVASSAIIEQELMPRKKASSSHFKESPELSPEINPDTPENDFDPDYIINNNKSMVLPIATLHISSSLSVPKLDYSDSNKYWIKPAKAMDAEDIISQSDNEYKGLNDSIQEEEAVKIQEKSLFLTCMECTSTILIKYPHNHLLAGDRGINCDKSHVFAVTKCRECITGSLKDDEYINISLEMENHDKFLSSLRISDKMIINSPSHSSANHIAGIDVPVLTKSSYIKYIPINIISKLCGRDTRSASIDTTECVELPYLSNGFL